MTEQRKNQKWKNGKDYSSIIGEKFSMLTILEVLPRERDGNGNLKPPECLCRCECGKTSKHRLYDVVNFNIMSCGCIKGKHGVDRDANIPKSIIEALSAIYYCKYITKTCVRSSKYNLCCHECDRYKNCPQACTNTPEKCGAQIRDDMTNIDDEE